MTPEIQLHKNPPEIEQHDDISEFHSDVFYAHCERIEFKEPYATWDFAWFEYEVGTLEELNENDPENDERVEKAKVEYEELALKLVNRESQNVCFDWRSQQELWIRYN